MCCGKVSDDMLVSSREEGNVGTNTQRGRRRRVKRGKGAKKQIRRGNLSDELVFRHYVADLLRTGFVNIACDLSPESRASQLSTIHTVTYIVFVLPRIKLTME